MGLDVYVGTFCRYYSRDWLTIVQQSFPGQVKVVGPSGTETPPDPGAVRDVVSSWCQGLAASLRTPSLWSESPSLPYFTDKPAWDGYGGLLLWAAYEDQGLDPARRREPVTTENWVTDEVLSHYKDLAAETRYPQLLLGEEMWLPIQSPAVFRVVDPAGNERVFGRCAALAADLALLNQRTLKADAATAEQWRRDGLEHGSSLVAAARFGWAVMTRLVEAAVEHELPIILDY